MRTLETRYARLRMLVGAGALALPGRKRQALRGERFAQQAECFWPHPVQSRDLGLADGSELAEVRVAGVGERALRRLAHFRRERQVSLLALTVAFALAAVLGPTAGGFLTDTVGWRWIFFLNIPVVVAALAFFLTTYAPAARNPVSSRPIGFGDLDFAGFGTFATAVVVFLLALSLGGHQLAWWSGPEVLRWPSAVGELRPVTLLLIGAFRS